MTPERARRSVDWLFRRFHLFYGRRWIESYAGLPLDEVAAGWSAELTAYTEHEVVRGANACKTSKFPPTLPEFLSFCRPETASNRPAGDEAWAIAVRAADEAETVVWTEEIAEAWGIAKPVFEGGDEVGARMAFRASYERLTADAKVAGIPAKWVVSQGHDPERRAIAVERAQVAGLLPAPVVEQFVPLLESRKEPEPTTDVAARLAELRAAIAANRPAKERESERERTNRLKAEAARRIEDHQKEGDHV